VALECEAGWLENVRVGCPRMWAASECENGWPTNARMVGQRI
jgi:hypothetical protein